MSVAYSLSSTSLTVIVNFTPKVVPSSHPNFRRLVELLKQKDVTEAQLDRLLDIPQAISSFTGGAVSVQGGKLYFRGFELKTTLAKKIMSFINAGDDALAAPLMAFLNNALQNPDPRAAADLFDWLQASGLPITTDGFVLAWKAVGQDYMSIHSGRRGKLSHKLGETVSEPRTECDDNPDQTCSRGLHFCSADYLKNYGGGGARIVVVKINPRDVVAFPRDYGLAKGRACEYQVVGEVPLDQVATFYPQGSPVYAGFDSGYSTPVSSPKARRVGMFAVGQVWKTRGSGQEVTILSIDGEVPYQITASNGATYRTDGRYSTEGTRSIDLVKLITDVA